jgi:hypothetical protein
MSRYTHFTKLEHLIFPKGGSRKELENAIKSLASIFLQIEVPAPACGDTTGDTPLGVQRRGIQHQKQSSGRAAALLP